ncbi:MAG: hypothetical protein JSV69_14245, partial [Chloroflexota bacterium]
LMATPERFAELNQYLDGLLLDRSRSASEVHRSMMVGCIFGQNDKQLEERVAARTKGERTAEDLRERGAIVGTSSQMADQIHELAEAGVERVMLQWIDLDDIDGLEAIAKDVLPQFEN